MTVSESAVGLAFQPGTNTTTINATNWPGGSGGGLLFLVPFANDTETVPTCTDPDIKLIGSGYGGSAATFAEDAGRRGVAAFFCEDGSKTVAQFNQPAGAAGAVMTALGIRVTKSLTYWGVHTVAACVDSASGANFSGASLTNPGSASGDLVYVQGSTIPSATSIGFSMVWTGSGITTLTSVKTGQNTSGYNIRHNVSRGAPTGVASANPTVNGTVDETGIALVVVLRDTNTAPVPPTRWKKRQSGAWVPATRKVRVAGAWV